MITNLTNQSHGSYSRRSIWTSSFVSNYTTKNNSSNEMSAIHTLNGFQSKELPVPCIESTWVVVVEDVGEFVIVCSKDQK